MVYRSTFPILSADANGTCQFNPLHLQTNCTIDLNGENVDLETSKVPGVVTLEPGRNMCNETKNIFVYNGKHFDIIINILE